MSTGHFTQVVWKSTTHQGCARCAGKGQKRHHHHHAHIETYVICEYKPPGNYQDEFADNVL
jgi:glioma pathogenesis-related protein 2